MRTSKDTIVLILTIGVVSLLGAIVVREIYMTYKVDREISSEVLHVLQNAIVGLIGIIGVYLGGKNKSNNNENNENKDNKKD